MSDFPVLKNYSKNLTVPIILLRVTFSLFLSSILVVSLQSKNHVLRYLVILFLVLLNFQITLSQEKMNSTRYLEIQLEFLKNTVLPHDENIFQEDFRAPLIDEVEIRTETEDLQLQKQRYELRLSPSSLRLMQAQEFLHKAYVKEARSEYSKLLGDFMIKASDTWLQAYMAKKELTAFETTLTFQKDLHLAGLEDIKSKDHKTSDKLKIESTINDLTVRIFKSKLKTASVLKEFGDTTFRIIPDHKNLISFHSILNIAQSNKELINGNDPESLVRQYELSAEVAQKNKIFDFFKANYTGPHEDPFSEKFNIGMAFRLPIAGQSKIDIRERKIDLFVRQNEAAMETAMDNWELNSERKKLIRSIRAYFMLEKLKEEENNNISHAISTHIESDDFSPDELLKLYELQLDNHLELLEAEEDVWDNYLDFLDAGNYFGEQPLRDYLSQGLPEIVN